MRIKSFVTAQARIDIANFSMLHGLQNVIRIQTDSVSFSKEINNAKSTGLIHFYNGVVRFGLFSSATVLF